MASNRDDKCIHCYCWRNQRRIQYGNKTERTGPTGERVHSKLNNTIEGFLFYLGYHNYHNHNRRYKNKQNKVNKNKNYDQRGINNKESHIFVL